MNREIEELHRAKTGIVGSRCEKRLDAVGFLLQNAGFFVFAVMASVVAVRFFFLVEVETYVEIFAAEFCVHMETRIARRRKRADKAHFVAILALENIPRAPEEIDGIVGNVVDDEFHSVGALGIVPSLHPPEGCVLPVYDAPRVVYSFQVLAFREGTHFLKALS